MLKCFLSGAFVASCLFGSVLCAAEIKLVKQQDYTWKFDNTAGKQLIYKLKCAPDEEVPRRLSMDVLLGDSIEGDWDIEHVIGFSSVDAKPEEELGPEGPAMTGDRDPKHYVGIWQDLESKDYYAVVSLHSEAGASREKLDRALKYDRKAVRVRVGK